MAVLEHPAADPLEVAARFAAAMEAHDLDGVIAALASDFILRSPITNRITVNGRDEMRELMRPHFATVTDVRYFADVGDHHTRAQFYRAQVNGQPVEVATRLQLNDAAEISEITVYVRPLPGLTAMAAALVPPIAAGRHGRVRASVGRLLITPLALLTRLGDRLTTWFA